MGALVASTLFFLPLRAGAIPVFAHRYGFTCQQCHTTVPHLNGFGLRFYRNGFRLPGRAPVRKDASPVAFLLSTAYSSEPDATGLPKAIVDEIEVLSGGSEGHFSYFSNFYVLDGGRPGLPRDNWLSYWGTPSRRGTVLRIKGGNMTLPLPADPETFRETQNHYAVFDQTVGSNPFNFFDPHFGTDIAFGNPNRGFDAHVLFLSRHDPQSPLHDRGLDSMASLQWTSDKTTVSAYHYRGKRSIGGPADAFTRYGAGVSLRQGKLNADVVMQEGTDTNGDGSGSFLHSSGGFAQIRWAFSRGVAGIVRYDGTADTSGNFLRSTTAGMNLRVLRNGHLIVEDLITHVPAAKHTLNAGFLLAY